MDDELTGGGIDDDDPAPFDERADDELVAELAAVLRPRLAPPPQVLEAAREFFTWRTVDAELALLVHDSLVDVEQVASRSSGPARMLTFEIAAVQIEVEVDPAPDGRRVLGQLTPPVEADITLHSGEVGAEGTAVATRSDPLGRFVVALPDGRPLISVRVTFADGSTVQTARVRL